MFKQLRAGLPEPPRPGGKIPDLPVFPDGEEFCSEQTPSAHLTRPASHHGYLPQQKKKWRKKPTQIERERERETEREREVASEDFLSPVTPESYKFYQRCGDISLYNTGLEKVQVCMKKRFYQRSNRGAIAQREETHSWTQKTAQFSWTFCCGGNTQMTR